MNTIVYKGILDLGKEGKQEVAVRQLEKGVQKPDTIRFMQEIAILTQIHHPSIVQFHGMVENENPVSIIIVIEIFSCNQTMLCHKALTLVL